MEIGDVFVLLMIGVGLLSSLFGQKKQQKRKPPVRPARPQPRLPERAESDRADANAARSRSREPAGKSDRTAVLSHMEQILRELQLGPQAAGPRLRPAEPEPAAETEVPESRPRSRPRPVPAPARPVAVSPPARSAKPPVPTKKTAPAPSARGESLEEIPADYAAYRKREHEGFHARIAGEASPASSATAPRARAYLDRSSLRRAILASEILGPPVGLR